MTTIILCSVGLLICFYLLSIVCEDYFVHSLEKISEKLRLSEDVAGATLMAIGSSAPELFTSLIAITRSGIENVGAGTIVGSAIFNILVIIGVSAMVATAFLNWKPVIRDLLFYIASILVLLFTFQDGRISKNEALVYLGLYLFYLVFLSIWSAFAGRKTSEESEQEPEEERSGGWLGSFQQGANRLVGMVFPRQERYLLVFLISILLIGALSWGLVELAVVVFADSIGISPVIVALTVLAAGTSVPDLLSSIIVARRGKGDMAVSNAVGSNTFDILIGLGLPWMIYILWHDQSFPVSTKNLASSILLLFATVVALLFLLCFQKFKIGRYSGLFLVALYLAYLAYAIYGAYHPDPLGIDAWVEGWTE